MARRNQLTNLIKSAEDLIVAADKLHSHVTKNFSTAASRIPGFVFHCSKIEVGGDGYMYDWAFIQIDEGKLETKDVTGNMVFVGGNKTDIDWERYLFSQHHDRREFHVPPNLLLPIRD